MANILNILDKGTGKYVSIPAIQGASAYEVAVENGFEGTEEEWLISLKGDGADVDMSNYATIKYVDDAIENLEVDIDGADINLEGYATEQWTKDYITDNLETITNGYYEPIEVKGEDITDDILEANGMLPILKTYPGGTKYLVTGGVNNFAINAVNEADTFYENDYQYIGIDNRFEIDTTADGGVSDYIVYGAYNTDLLTKTDMSEPHTRIINQYLISNRGDRMFPKDEKGATFCGWAFYGSSTYDGSEGQEQWLDRHMNAGTVSKEVQDKFDSLNNNLGLNFEYSDGTPGTGYKKYPAIYMKVEPFTTYTINYTGDTEGEQDYMKGLHYCLLTELPSGGGCGRTFGMHHVRHLVDTYTSTFTTGAESKYLVISVGNIRHNLGSWGTLTSDSSAYIDKDIVAYNLNNLSVVQGNRTYEYYIDLIKDIDFDLSIIAMSMVDNSVYQSYDIKIPYIMKSNQYFRLVRDRDMFVVSHALTRAVGMRIDEIEDSTLNYKVNDIGVIGRWIDNKDIHRCVINTTLPKYVSSTSYAGGTSVTLPDTVDCVVDLRITRLVKPVTGERHFFGNNYCLFATSEYETRPSYSLSASVSTTLPTTAKPTDFFSKLNITYGEYVDEIDVAIIIDYTKFELNEDGTIT